MSRFWGPPKLIKSDVPTVENIHFLQNEGHSTFNVLPNILYRCRPKRNACWPYHFVSLRFGCAFVFCKNSCCAPRLVYILYNVVFDSSPLTLTPVIKHNMNNYYVFVKQLSLTKNVETYFSHTTDISGSKSKYNMSSLNDIMKLGN